MNYRLRAYQSLKDRLIDSVSEAQEGVLVQMFMASWKPGQDFLMQNICSFFLIHDPGSPLLHWAVKRSASYRTTPVPRREGTASSPLVFTAETTC